MLKKVNTRFFKENHHFAWILIFLTFPKIEPEIFFKTS